MDKNKNITYYLMTYGLYLAGGMIVFELLTYLTDIQSKSVFYAMLAGTIWIGLFAWALVYFASVYRKKQLNNYMSYGKAFQFSISLVFYASLPVAIFMFVLYGIIDTEFIAESMAKTTENVIAFYENMGIDDAIIESMEEKLDEQEVPTKAKIAFSSILSNVVIGFFVSLFTSIGVQKKEPIFKDE